jgi:DNA polymerase phi
MISRADFGLYCLTVEALHFKQRVLDLVEIYLRKQQTNPLVLSFIPILLTLSQSSAPAEKSLAEKAKAILLRRFGNAVEVPVIEDVEAAKKTLEAIHNTARRTSSKEVGKACSNVSIFMAKAFNLSQSEGAASAVTEIYRASLKDFLSRKTSKLSPTFFQAYLERQPLQAWALRDDILRYARGDAVNDFHYLSALNLLSAVAKQFSNVVKAGEKESVEAYVEDCRKVLYEALETKGSAAGSWNAPRVKEVIKACLQMARLSQVVFDTPQKLAQAWSVEDLRNIDLTLRQTERLANNGSVFTLLGQFLLLVDPQAKEAQAAKKQQKQADKKRKLSEVASTVDESVTATKKGKKAGGAVKKQSGTEDGTPKKKQKKVAKKE